MEEVSFKNIILEYVALINKKMNTPEMKQMKEVNNYQYTKAMNEFLPKFREKYPKLYKKIINGDNLDNLNIFINKIDDIEHNKISFDDARNNLGQILHDKYVAPVMPK